MPHLSVAANMFLGDEMSSGGIMRQRAMTQAAQNVLDDLGFNLPAGEILANLTIGQQQLVATARPRCAASASSSSMSRRLI